jgi:nitrous oxide reductase accessory protein NosL
MRLINLIVLEITYWIAAHGGKEPAEVRVPQAILDALEDEAKLCGLKPKEHPAMKGEVHIRGIPIRADWNGSTVGRIVPRPHTPNENR